MSFQYKEFSAALIIDPVVAAFIHLAFDKKLEEERGTPVPSAIQALADKGTAAFAEAAAKQDKVLLDANYLNIEDAVMLFEPEECLGEDVILGMAEECEYVPLGLMEAEEGTADLCGTVAFVLPRKAPGYFEAPYEDLAEMACEFKEFFAKRFGENHFPPDFKWQDYIVSANVGFTHIAGED